MGSDLMRLEGWMLPLFVPATRPERFAKAAASGADAVIIDLEDAVAPEDKECARNEVLRLNNLGLPTILRINDRSTHWYIADLKCAKTANLSAVLLPKVETADDVHSVHLITGHPIIALIETIAALDYIEEIAQAPGLVQFALGTMDLAADLECAPDSRLMDVVRMDLLKYSARYDLAMPLDGVCLSIHDTDRLIAEARDIAHNGFGGRMLIHPAQICPTATGLMPSDAILTEARKIAQSDGGSGSINGKMVDAPVRRSAWQLLCKAKKLEKTGFKTP